MMRKSIVYLMIAAVVLTGLFVWGGNQGRVYANLGDNVTYTFPYLTTSSDKPVYCVVSNMTQDNASLHFYVLADSASLTTSATQIQDVAQNSAMVYAFQTRMVSFETMSVNIDGTSFGSLTGKVNANSNYAGSLRLSQQAAGFVDGVGNIATVKYGNATALDWTCGNLPMACFQGTTTPKRNLIGYMCSDEMMHQVELGMTDGATHKFFVRGNELTNVTGGPNLSALPAGTHYGSPYNKIYTY
ncbi:MAG: hypothetical protein HQK96_21220 [Nitrospirae bacterium]|nr:hypothetical protein [Nitrospirota bacterium]